MPRTFRTQRLTRGWTLVQLVEQCRAEGAKASTGQLSEIERGLRTPEPALRAALCRLLDLPLTYFPERRLMDDGRKNQGGGTKQTPKNAPKPKPQPKPKGK